MNIYEVYPGKYSISEIGQKTFICFIAYDSRDKYAQLNVVDQADLKPYHKLMDSSKEFNTRNKRLDFFNMLWNYEQRSYSSILR